MVNGFSSANPLLNRAPTSEVLKSEGQKKCELDGGRWENGKCIFPTQDREKDLFGEVGAGVPAADANKPPLPEGTIVNDEQGQPTGIINAQGDISRATRADLQNITNKRTGRVAPIEGGRT